MPYSRITGISSAGNARTVSPGSSRTGIGSDTAKPRLVAITQFSAISTTPMNTPGRIPPRNRYPIEESETSAYITIGIEGGMIGPMVDAAAVIAAA